MDPKILASKFAKKAAEETNEKETKKAAEAESQAALVRLSEDGKRAIAEVVIPYFNDIKAQFPPDQFSYDVQVDTKDHKPVGVSFTLGKGPLIVISTYFGRVTITQTNTPDLPNKVAFVYSPKAQPFIETPRDLTREKIGNLIEMVIEKRQPERA
jgi:hypothetical protein